ncbi:MAG TPA: 2-amino-4-hydroxy-6-hydroxymethyldihydropteridine diphosphokinase [Steroidobacteraceae bacterium]|nr:2-amino-4-hydroxy-6-hydroxymethyldihydropteridine diphosphokinase [Steroidobacteraceae bacterium]
MMWTPAYVAIGSNLSDPATQVRTAFERLGRFRDTRLVSQSRLYRTAPLGPQDQPQFVNACAGLLTQATPEALLASLRNLEREMGKVPPPVRWGPRVIDLDLLLFVGEQRATTELVLPHPRMHERNFVLYPLAELAPTVEVLGHGRVADLAERVGRQGLDLL